MLLSTAWVVGAWNWGRFDWSLDKKISQTWGYEKASLQLAAENRVLKAQMADLEHKLGLLESEKSALTAQVKNNAQARTIASVPKSKEEDMVNYDVYKWTPEKLLAIGEKELHFKNYVKSAQYYHELVKRFPEHKIVNDKTLFGAGIAAYEAKQHDWAIQHLSTLMEKYPKSGFYRGAKMWTALSQYNTGNHRKFASTVEEFRLKYRNTDEWKILSKYYEDINYKFKK
jgi:outer membrane protein assembly factor BamD (BamD/ComL family)